MKTSNDLRKETAAARHVCFVVANNFGDRAFLVDPEGPNARKLRIAERRGWCKWVAKDRCVLTPDGMREATTYTGVR
jgi:hypothetical protein